jgi:proline iminopeptidase
VNVAFVTHKFGKTHYTKKGRNKKTPVIWLHGGPGGKHYPDSNVFQLADNRVVYCYTQMGGGKSSATERKLWNVKAFVEELDLLIKAWGLTEFHLMGGSWGSTLALEYYIRKRGKGVQSLVFQSPMFSATDWKKDGRKLIKNLPKKTQRVINVCHEINATDARVYNDAMMDFYLKHILRNKKKLIERFSQPDSNGKQVYEYMWGPSEFEPTGTLKKYERANQLAKINVPSIIICGEHDEATPGTGARYARKIPGCQFHEVKSARHAIWDEKPARIRKVISGFLDDVESVG